MSYSPIDAVLKAYFDFMSKQEPSAMAEPGEIIPESMIDEDRPLQDGDYLVWKPIDSTVTEDELVALETFFGHALPGSYRHFLQQLHFVALYLDRNSLSFFPSFPGQLVSGTTDIVTKYYPDLSKRHLLPLANYGDWGVACFDASQPVPGGEYPVVLLEHEDGYSTKLPYTANFIDIFDKVAHGYAFLGAEGWKRPKDFRNDGQ